MDGSRLVDASADGLTSAEVISIAESYELIVIFTSTPSLRNDAALAGQIKARRPEALVGFVGPHVSVLPEETLSHCPAVDFVVCGEFEYPVSKIADGWTLSEVENVSWRKGSTVIHNDQAPLLSDLDQLPSVMPVYKQDLTIENYYGGYLLHPYISFYAGRGCPGRCTYCLWPQTFSSHEYRVRSPERVYEDLELAVHLFPQVKEYFIDDDTFTANPDRAQAVARLIKRLGITWSTSTRVTVSYDTMKVLRDCGLRLLMVGYESGSNEILNNIRKGFTTDAALQFARNAKDLGILVHGCFIVGLPGETPQTVEEMLRLACELDPDTIQVSVPAPYPGTHLYDQAVRNGWLVEGGLVSDDGAQTCPISYPNFSADDISAARDYIYRRFYFRPKVMWRIGIQMLKDKEVRRRRLSEGRDFIRFLRQQSSRQHVKVKP